jgi:hypothetical protein
MDRLAAYDLLYRTMRAGLDLRDSRSLRDLLAQDKFSPGQKRRLRDVVNAIRTECREYTESPLFKAAEEVASRKTYEEVEAETDWLDLLDRVE